MSMTKLFSGNVFLALSLGASLALFAGCPTDEPENGGGDTIQCTVDGSPTDVEVGEAPSCRKNRDCGGGSICEKADQADEFGCCLKILCTSNADCSDGELCDTRRGICLPENSCDPANPGPVCGTELCTYVEGAPLCQATTELPAADGCRISPMNTVAVNGAAMDFHVAGIDGSGALVPHGAFDLSASTGGTASGKTVTFSCTDATPCAVTVTATASGDNGSSGSCDATVTVFPDAAAADVRVTVFDQTNHTALSGVDVTIKDNGGNLTTQQTDANGSTTFAGASATLEAVSAFPTTHQWQTIIGPGTNDVAIFTIPNPNTDRVAGVKGTFNFDNTHTRGDIRFGLAGTSIASGITDLNFETLIGELADYNVTLEGVVENELIPLPSGLVIEVESSPIKSDFVVLGEPGPRSLWALGGKVKLSEIGPIISNVTASSDDINVGQILGAVLPFFARFDHAVVGGLNLTEQNRPASPGEDQATPYSAWPFDELTGANAVNLNTLLQQSVTFNVPTLPCNPASYSGGNCTDNDYVSGAILLTGTLVPVEGLLPLGLTAALDDPDEEDGIDQVDGKVDTLEDQPASGQAIVDFAPQHDGLEGNPLLTVALAVELDGITGGSLAISSLTHLSDSQSGTQSFPSSEFLPFQGGTYDEAAKTFSPDTKGSADFFRTALYVADDVVPSWNVWFKDAPTAIDYNTFVDGQDIGQRANTVAVQAFKLGNGYNGANPSNFEDLMGLSGTNMDMFVYYMGGWSNVTCVDPDADNPTPACSEAN
jgi:hypothetical protein